MKEAMHDVHILAVVRVLVKDIPAKSPKQAINKAQAQVNLDKILRQPTPGQGAAYVEFNDDIVGFIVDAKVGEKIDGTGVYDAHGKPTTLDSPTR